MALLERHRHDDHAVAAAPLRALGVAAIVAASLVAYYPCLDNFFSDIDDPVHLWHASSWTYAADQFRPLQAVWNGMLRRLFGLAPFGYHLAGLGLHALNACLVAAFVRRLGGTLPAGLAAGLAFAVFYAGSEAVMWFGAHAGLLSVTFVLVCCHAWVRHLRGGGRRSWVVALVGLAGAMGSKEDCVLLGPVLVALDLALRGPRRFVCRETVLRYLPFALLGAAYLLVAFDPQIWIRREGVGSYRLSAAMVPEIVRSLGVLFWPRAVDPRAPPAWALAAGLAVLAGTGAAAVLLRRQRRLLGIGLVVAVCGFLAVAPGPASLAARRYAYPSSVGAALILGGALAALWQRAGPVRILAAAGLGCWMAVQVLAIHSIECWRFAAHGEVLRHLVTTTRARILPELDHPGARPALMISPWTWNEAGYRFGVAVFDGWPVERISSQRVHWGPGFQALLGAGDRLDPARQPVFTCREDGRVFRLHSPAQAPVATWAAMARRRAAAGFGSNLEVVRIRPRDRKRR